MADYTAQIESIYLAYYGRPADVTGLAYWNTALNTAKGDLTAIINSFGTSDEATTLYSSSSNIAKVNAIYLALFNRTADTEGLVYYTGLLDNGIKSQASIALDILNGATGDDETLIEKKLDVSADFTAAMQTDATAMIAYAGTTAATTARAMLSAVTATSDDSGVVATTLATIEDTTTEETTADAQTFTLTTGSDDINTVTATLNDGATELTFVAGDGDDTFRATAGTLNDDDLLDGGEGSDTLNAYLNAAVAPIITNIETINVISRNAAASLDLTDISDVDTITATGNNDLDIIEIDPEAAPTISVSDYSDTLTLTLADDTGEADTLTLEVDGMSAESIIDVTNAVEIIALTASGEASEFTLADSEGALETVTVSGAGDVNVTFTSTDTTFVAFDASDATGGVTMTVSTTSALAATGGSGDDTFEFGTTLTASDTVVGGAGDDTLTFTIASTGSVRPTVSGVEIVDATFTAAGTLNLLNGATVTTVEVGSSSANMAISNASVAFTDVTVADDADFDLDVDYKSGVVGDLTITIGDSSEGEGASVDVDAVSTDAVSLTIASLGDAANSTDTLTAASATSLTFTTASADSDLTVGNISADAATSITITATGGDITVGTYATADTLTTLDMTATGAGSITVGIIGGTTTAALLTDITATLGTGSLTMSEVNIDAGAGETSALTSVEITSAGESIQLAAGGIFIDGVVAGDTDLDSFTITATGDDLALDVGDVDVSNIDEIKLTLSGEDGVAQFDLFEADEDIGDITITVGGSYAATFDDIDSAGDIGDITITAGKDATVTLSDVDAAGDMGDVTLSAADNGAFILTLIADSVGTIDASDTDSDSNVTIDAAAVTSAVTITLGAGTNAYTASLGDDDITLEASGGTDTITTGSAPGSITIDNFEVGTTGDDIELDISGLESLLAAGADETVSIIDMTDELAAADTIVLHTATVATATTRDMDNATAGSNILVLSGTFDDAAAVIDATDGIADGGTFELTLGDALAVGDGFLVLWDDGTDSYLSLIENATAIVADGAALVAANLSITTLVTFTGIADVTTIVAGNFAAIQA